MFKGCAVALVTPMFKDGRIDYECFISLLDIHIDAKTVAVVVAGTTGESSTLTIEEHLKLVEVAVNYVQRRVMIIAGTGSNETKIALYLSQRACSLGVDGLLVINPYYNKTNRSGLIKYFKMIAEAVDIPIILYNVPSRTGQSIPVDVVVELSKINNIIGIKEASGDLEYLIDLSYNIPEDFALYSGNDDQIIVALALNAKGVISVAANIIPNEISSLVTNYLAQDTRSAYLIHNKYLPLIKSLFSEVNPIPIKKAMNMLGYQVNDARLPLDKLSEECSTILKIELQKVGLLS